MARAWELHQPDITSVLIGGRIPAHLHQAFAALALTDARLLADLSLL
jgi:aryl-alcohol dehydrogenase-like predicted oxidoreductase